MSKEHETSTGNVFKDLELPNPEAHLEKSKIVVAIQKEISLRGYSLDEAAVMLGISEDRFLDICRGRFAETDSVESLNDLYTRLTK